MCCFKNSLQVSEDGKKALVALSGGDMRKVLNVLQSTWMAYKDVTEENVYTCVGHPQKIDITNIVGWLLNIEDFKECFNSKFFQMFTKKILFKIIYIIEIQDLKTDKGLALEDILREIHLFVMRSKMFSILCCEYFIKKIQFFNHS